MVEEVVAGAAPEPVFAAASKGMDARGPLRIRESRPDSQALAETAPIFERDGTDGSLVIGYETGATAGERADALTARPTADTSGSRAFVRVGSGSGDDAAVTLGPKLNIGPLTIEPVQDAEGNTTVQFIFNGEPYMIFKEGLIQVTKGFQAAELSGGGGSGGTGTTVSFGGVQFGTVPIIENMEPETALAFETGGAFVDGNGYLRVAYARDQNTLGTQSI